MNNSNYSNGRKKAGWPYSLVDEPFIEIMKGREVWKGFIKENVTNQLKPMFQSNLF